MTIYNYDFVLKFGTTGTGNGELNNPLDIATDSTGNVFVVDEGNDRIQKFTAAGVYVSQFGTTGAGNGQFGSPMGIAIDSSDNIYVTDYDNDRVQKFTSAGSYSAQWAVDNPRGIAVDPSGNIVVSGTPSGTETVYKYSNTGTLLWTSALTIVVYGLQCDSSGNIYAATTGYDVSGTVYYLIKLSGTDGSLLANYGIAGNGGELFFNTPIGITITTGGNVCISDQSVYSISIQEVTAAGAFVTGAGRYGELSDPSVSGPTTLDGFFNGIYGIHCDTLGNIYVADSSNDRIQKLKRNTYVLKN